MRNATSCLVWAFLACAGHGRRVHTYLTRTKRPSADGQQSLKVFDSSSSRYALVAVNKLLERGSPADTINTLRALTFFMLSSAAAFNPSSPRLYFVGHSTSEFVKHASLDRQNQFVSGCFLAMRVNDELAQPPEVDPSRKETLADSSINFWTAAAAISERSPQAPETKIRSTSTKFWTYDVSGGAGAISSPVLEEHPTNYVEAPQLRVERVASWLFDRVPQWLLFSTLGVLTREIAVRSVEDSIPEWQQDPEAKRKASALAKELKFKFNTALQYSLAPANWGSADTFMRRFVNDQRKELEKPELVQKAVEVFSEEFVGKCQQSITGLLQFNQSSAERDLNEILRRADRDGNDVVTLDEFFRLLTGQEIPTFLEATAKQTPVLKSTNSTATRWERWWSLLCAPLVKPVVSFASFLQKLVERVGQDVREQSREAGGFFGPFGTFVLDAGYKLDKVFANLCECTQKMCKRMLQNFKELRQKPKQRNLFDDDGEAG